MVFALHFYASQILHIISNYKPRNKSSFSLVQEPPAQRVKQYTNSPYSPFVLEAQIKEFKQLLFKFMDNYFPKHLALGINSLRY